LNVDSKGYSLLEVLMAITLLVILAGTAIPLAHNSVDRSRAAGAASYVAGRMAMARFEAVRRSAYVAIRFLQSPEGYWIQTYVDRNRNGVLSSDIVAGVDQPISAAERLDYHFRDVVFGIQSNVTGIDAGPFNPADPIQIGSSTLLSFSPMGSSTSGTVFIHGRERNQFAVRVLGATGRTRILEFSFGAATWLAR
jgi:prepilin-type N-terminal cleavage/methylation domain-containing protein